MTQREGPAGPVEIIEVLTYDDGAAAAVADLDGGLQAELGIGALDESDRLHLRHRGLKDARLWLAREQAARSDRPVPDQSARALGFALVREHGDEPGLVLAVAGAAEGHGLGSALAATVAGQYEGRPLRAWSHVDHRSAPRLAERHGLRRARELLVMRRPASDLPPLPEHPGIEIGAYTDADRDDLLAVNAAAFAHHPEQGAMDAANLAERMAQDWYSPAGLLVARDGETGAFLGFHWTKTARRPDAVRGPDERDADADADADADGEVYVVGVAPDAQGRGLGRLLTLAGLHHLAGWGVRTIELYVEGDNHPARAVYERLGFRVGETHVQYAGVVTPADPDR